MNREQVFETVKKYILEQLPVKPERVTEDAKMVDDLGARRARLMLTEATRDLLRRSLSLIGIAAPERM